MMRAHLLLLILAPLAYVWGSIPIGLIVGKANGIDPRRQGSGNIGATNVGRLLGGKFFALVFLLDVAKGLLPVWIAGKILGFYADSSLNAGLWIMVAFATVLGNVCSVFLKFHGGKGVATSAGIMLGIYPYFTVPALVGLLVFFMVLRLTRYVSVASMSAAMVFPIACIAASLLRGQALLGPQWPLLLFAIVVAGLILFKHRTNLARLRAGTESRWRPKSSAITTFTGDASIATDVSENTNVSTTTDVSTTGDASTRAAPAR